MMAPSCWYVEDDGQVLEITPAEHAAILRRTIALKGIEYLAPRLRQLFDGKPITVNTGGVVCLRYPACGEDCQ